LIIRSKFGPKLHYLIKSYDKNAVLGGHPPAGNWNSGRGTLYG